MNTSKSYTFKPALNPLCDNCLSLTKGNYQSPPKYLLHSRNECDPGSTCSSPGWEWLSFTSSLFVSFQAWAQLAVTRSAEQCRSRLKGNNDTHEDSLTNPSFSYTVQNKDCLCSWAMTEALNAGKCFGFTPHIVLEPTDLYLCDV